MNRLLLSILLSMAFHISQGQSSMEKVDERISAYLGEEIVDKILTERPAYMAYYEYKLNKSYKLIELSEVQEKEIILIEVDLVTCKDHNNNSVKYSPEKVIDAIQKDEFNILTSSFSREKDAPSYYLLKGTDQVIFLESERSVNVNYKKN